MFMKKSTSMKKKPSRNPTTVWWCCATVFTGVFALPGTNIIVVEDNDGPSCPSILSGSL
jgi:hypothetical protein